MKKAALLTTLLLMLLAAASTAQAQKVEKDPDGTPGKKYPVRLLPDLAVGLLNQFDSSVIIRVANKCKGKSEASYLTITVPDDKGSPVSIGKEVPALAPGGSASVTVTIPSNLNIKSFRNKWMRIVVDPSNKIKEASEGNNWWEPNAQPFPEGAGYCDPPYNK